MKKPRASREAILDLMDRANPVITRVFEKGRTELKETIQQIGFRVNSSKVKMTTVLTELEVWLRDVVRDFPEDAEAKKLLQEAESLADRNPHLEWRS